MKIIKSMFMGYYISYVNIEILDRPNTDTILYAILKESEAQSIFPKIILFCGITTRWGLDHLLGSLYKSVL